MDALYYPFHLCNEHTLTLLLEEYHIVHFRAFMALQLTPMMGTTAFPDRMGDYYPEALNAGRIIQGYNLNGPMTPQTIAMVNRDLADPQWRRHFQESLLNNHRFQRGLFADSKDESAAHPEKKNEPEWFQFKERKWMEESFDVKMIQDLSRQRLHGDQAAQFEYGWALIKTAASLIYTIHLCHLHNLVAATDSSTHFQLLKQTCKREGISLRNSCVNLNR